MSTNTLSPAQQRINKARWWALRNAKFDGALAMNLPDVIGNPHGDTACTDGKTIYWSEDFVNKLTDPELRFVLLHETAHCALGHFWRLPPDELGNMAGDYAINSTLTHRGLDIKMPDGGLYDPKFKDMAEENILAVLKKQKPQNGDEGGNPKPGSPQPGKPGNGDPKQGNGKQSNQCGDFVKPKQEPGTDPAKAQQKLKEQWERRVVQAVQMAQASGAGQVPGEYARLASGLVAPAKVDWRQETADFLRQQIGQRNDWSRSSRRMGSQSFIYPRKQRDSAGTIVAARDTSGSVTDEQIALFNAALEQVAAELNCEVILMDADTRVRTERRVAAGEPFPADATGGGGTCFQNTFERAEELVDNGESIAGLVYLTDLAGSHYNNTPSFPTLWICPQKQFTPPPFGRTVTLT